MKNFTLIISCSLMLFSFLCSFPPQSSIKFDYESAGAMLEVIQAIHNATDIDSVEYLLDNALKMDAYQICSERYTNPSRSRENQVSLNQFKKFMLSFLGDSVDIQNNRRIGFMKGLYTDAIKDPGKYSEALRRIESLPDSRIQESLEIALHWLPEKMVMNVNVLILFDIGGGAWAYKTKDGRHHAAFNILLMLDEEGNFDQDNFLGTLAHELNHIGEPLKNFNESINYESLNDTSRLKLYTDFVAPLLGEGLAQKFCSNAPGKFTQKPYSDKKFAAIERARQNWEYYIAEFNDIHNRAINDLKKILNGEITDPEEFMSAYTIYWTWHAGKSEGKDFVLGRRYYYGSELLGIITEGLGKEAMFESIRDFRKLLPLYNKGLIKLKPEGYQQYLFPDDIVKVVEKL